LETLSDERKEGGKHCRKNVGKRRSLPRLKGGGEKEDLSVPVLEKKKGKGK